MTSLAQDKKKTVQNAVKESLKELTVIEGGNNGDNRDIPPEEIRPPEETCPVQPLGHLNGIYYFIDTEGQLRQFSTSQLSRREELVSLFGGNKEWMVENFPHWAKSKKPGEVGEIVIVDFERKDLSDWLNVRCVKAGLFSNEVKIRNPGVWKSEAGYPIIHCGNVILMNGEEYKPGLKLENQLWVAAPTIKRPGKAISCGDVLQFEESLKELWNFKTDGSSIIILGWLCCAYLGASINWRPALFLVGSAGSGKSTLMSIIRACCPAHFYTNDTTKAGLEQTLEGRSIPSFVDEASDGGKIHQVQDLMDMILSASGGEGANSVRGSKEGKARSALISASIMLASINPPNMQEQHLGRFTLVELKKAQVSQDFSLKYEELQQWAEKHGAGLWGRALDGWKRFSEAKILFRKALLNVGCSNREIDQIGAILSGYWILSNDGLPDLEDAKDFADEIGDFLRSNEEDQDKSEISSVRDILLSSTVQVNRSTDKRTIAKLILQAICDPSQKELEEKPDFFNSAAQKTLETFGIRVIPPFERVQKSNGKPPPRPDGQNIGMGIWIWPKSEELKKLFKETPYSGDRLESSLKRFPTAFIRKDTLSIASMRRRNCIWISSKDLQLSMDDIGVCEDENTNPF